MGKNMRGADILSAERMSDAELSKKLGHYQRLARVWMYAGLFGVLGGVVSFFAVQDALLKAILVAVLFFGGICCVIFLSGGAQKKLKVLSCAVQRAPQLRLRFAPVRGRRAAHAVT